MSSLTYTHPSTHPASMITGLSEYITNLGYGKVVTGSYVGDGTGEAYTYRLRDPRSITLPFEPSVILIFGNDATYINAGNDITAGTMYYMCNGAYCVTYATGVTGGTITTIGTEGYLIARLSGTTLYVTSGDEDVHLTGPNISNITYTWIAF